MLKTLKKMRVSDFPNPKYSLEELDLNTLLNQNLSLKFTGKINCINCQKSIKKSFNQGYCFPCFQKLAACDLCILRPEKCHYHLGTCREPEWGEQHCLITHSIYLANSAGLKVGITRTIQKETRWVDQGAIQVLEIGTTTERLKSGLIEVELKKYFNDRSDWRKLVTGKDPEINLLQEFANVRSALEEIKELQINPTPQEFVIHYPVSCYPQKAVSFNEKKEQSISGILNGIRGQYLLIGEQVINIRKFQGYQVEIEF